ncbi:MAG: hypothetical protein GY817_06375 [bacterium]|nr:hypothetical protein [bacterium]
MEILSDTSALVLMWAGTNCYNTDKAKEYLEKLDLSAGQLLYDQCNEVCSYYDEVIKNRKWGIFSLLNQVLSRQNKDCQLVIAAAGLDPLGIEISEYYPEVRIFELDKENMDIKFNLYNSLCGNKYENIAFIETDILNTMSVQKSLSNYGWDPKKNTILVLEGISYYLSTESIQKFIQVLHPDFIIFEFLKEDENIASDKASIPKEIFGIIFDYCNISEIRRDSYSKLENTFNNMFIIKKYNMKYLEAMRTGNNSFFPTKESGWIEVCLLAKELL